MKIFLTGAAGFLGSCVLRQLLAARDVQVAALVRRPEEAWRIRDELPQVRLVAAGLDDEPAIAAVLRDFGPSHLVHLAWSGVLGRSRNDADQPLNAMRTERLLEMGLQSGARHFVGLGSQAEYGPCQARIDESAATAPTTRYGMAKLAACEKAARLCEGAGARFAWLRLFSSYGPRDNPEWMIPYLTLKLLHRERPSMTAAEQRWDYIYVDDAAAAIVAVAQAPAAAGVFNLGSGTARPLRAIIERVRDEIDPGLSIGFGELPYRPDQVMHLEADIRRLVQATGWHPRTGFDEGIPRTVDWYRTHDAGH